MEQLFNMGGAPPNYEDNEKGHLAFSNKSNEYFESIFDREFNSWIEPPTVTGLALYLGFDSRQSIYDYKKKSEQFSYIIKRALATVEKFHEIKAAMGDKCTGNIFVLKNMGWSDSKDIDIKTGGEKIQQEQLTPELLNKLIDKL